MHLPSDVKTTRAYTHVLNRGPAGVRSTADLLWAARGTFEHASRFRYAPGSSQDIGAESPFQQGFPNYHDGYGAA